MANCERCQSGVGCPCNLKDSNHWKLKVCLACLIDGNNLDEKKLNEEILRKQTKQVATNNGILVNKN